MKTIEPEKLEILIEECLNDFYQRRFYKLNELKLKTVLRGFCPYPRNYYVY